MKRWLGILTLALLLAGCGANHSPAPTGGTETTPSAITTPSEPEEITPPLTSISLGSTCNAIAPMGDDLLLFGDGTLTLFSTESMNPVVTDPVGDLPLPGSGRIQIHEEGIAYYDAGVNAVVYLDALLQETARLQLPEKISTSVYLAPDWGSLYYCTDQGIRLCDLDTGICRNLMLQEGSWSGINGALLGGSLLRCTLTQEDGTQRTLLISAETGELLREGDELNAIVGESDFYSCVLGTEWVFGWGSGQPHNLRIESQQIIPLSGAALSIGSALDYYDLVTGRRTASIEWQNDAKITGCTTSEGCVWLCGGETLYRWDLALSPVEDETVYTSPRYTAEDPDEEGLAVYQQQALALEQEYGIDILLWNEVNEVVPENYSFEAEFLPQVYKQGFTALKTALAQFPAVLLSSAAQWTENQTLHIVLVRSMEGAEAAHGDLPGMHYLLDGGAYIALELTSGLEQAFYHNLSHMIDSLVLIQSDAYDNWNKLNPSGFRYRNAYGTDSDGAEKYLDGSSRYFIDPFSMSFGVEDRARILEYAIMPGNEAYFESKHMQSKLKCVCKALREVFDLEDGIFIWEQYLQS